MITEIPTQSGGVRHVVGTVLFIILAAGVSALILTAPVWSADDLALPASGRATPLQAPDVTPAGGSEPRGDVH